MNKKALLMRLSWGLLPALLLRWEQSLGGSKADLTAAITLAIFVSAMFAPLSGRLIDRGRGALLKAGRCFLGAFCLIWISQVTGKLDVCTSGQLHGNCLAGGLS